jgi:hypothetical protein
MGNEATSLAKVDMESGAGVQMRKATDSAGVCREIVLRTVQSIQGKKYVKVEGWQAIANTFGCVASARDVEEVAGGIRAIGEVRRMSDGQVVATGEGFVGDDEPTWAKRPMFARRAMAQTRAISRACRSAFAFVVVLIDSGLSTTPAEEMDGIVEAEKAAVVPGAATAALKSKVAPIAGKVSRMPIIDEPSEPPPPTPPPAAAPPAQSDFEDAAPMRFGSGKGKPIAKLTDKDLAWYAKALTENCADPDKADWLDSNQAALGTIRAEQARRAR